MNKNVHVTITRFSKDGTEVKQVAHTSYDTYEEAESKLIADGFEKDFEEIHTGDIDIPVIEIKQYKKSLADGCVEFGVVNVL